MFSVSITYIHGLARFLSKQLIHAADRLGCLSLRVVRIPLGVGPLTLLRLLYQILPPAMKLATILRILAMNPRTLGSCTAPQPEPSRPQRPG